MTERRRALGRGLGALISGSGPAAPELAGASDPQPSSEGAGSGGPESPEDAGTTRELRVEDIDPNPDQPRRVFDSGELEGLAASILRYGVLQPLVVRKAGSRYELIVGERRWRASRAAGLATVPVVIADLAPQERLEVAIVENVQRHDLNPMELAHAYRALIDSGATQEEVAQKVARDRSSIANHLRLLDLAPDHQADVEAGRLSMGHAKALMQLPDAAQRRKLRDRVIAQGLSVRATEKFARKAAGPRRSSSSEPRVERLDPDLTRVVEALQRRYQARVHLNGNAEKGRVEIEYFEAEELHRILGLMLGED